MPYPMQPRRFGIGGGWDPNARPAPTTPVSRAPTAPLGGIASGIIQGGQQAGYFDPNGSPVMRAQRRREALRMALARRRRGATASRLYGLDPMSARAQAGADSRQSGADVSNFLNESQFQESQGNQAFARGVFQDRLGVEDQLAAEKRAERRNRFSVGGFLGGLAGQAVGAYTGGLAGGLGRGGQDEYLYGSRMGQRGFQYPRY